jgi:endogenous inhibitor of DNA gyrase (YacG/DUF329 family)
LIDLGRWVDEEYRVPVESVTTEEFQPEEQPRDESEAEWNN